MAESTNFGGEKVSDTLTQLLAAMVTNLAESQPRYVARNGQIHMTDQGVVATAKSGTFARRIASALNHHQKVMAMIRALETVAPGADAAQVAAIRRSIEDAAPQSEPHQEPDRVTQMRERFSPKTNAR